MLLLNFLPFLEDLEPPSSGNLIALGQIIVQLLLGLGVIVSRDKLHLEAFKIYSLLDLTIFKNLNVQFINERQVSVNLG